MDFKAYEARAGSVRIRDIVSDEGSDQHNELVLRGLRKQSPDYDLLRVQQGQDYYLDHDGELGCAEFVPRSSRELGWLAYFVAINNSLDRLIVKPFPGFDDIEFAGLLYEGVARNRSIREINFHEVDFFGGKIFTIMGSFFEGANLKSIKIDDCIFGDEGRRQLAMAIRSSTAKSLEHFYLTWNDADDDGMAEIIAALSTHPDLYSIELNGSGLGKSGCVALAKLVGANTLDWLKLSSNLINDEGLETLVPAFASSRHLRRIDFSRNLSITTRGWQSLASLLEASRVCRLTTLSICGTGIDDEAIATFASALKGNTTLHTLDLSYNISITDVGWLHLSKAVCDTSSVNATYLSNHTLQSFGIDADDNVWPFDFEMHSILLRDDQGNCRGASLSETKKAKILEYHEHFDMKPLFEWEFKFMPMVADWLDRASVCEQNTSGFDANIEGRKLYCIYQFVRAMPVEYVEACLRKKPGDIKAKQR